MRLLLLSNGINPGQTLLAFATDWIRDILRGVTTARFAPYASVRGAWDDYTAAVAKVLTPLGVEVEGLHTAKDPVAAAKGAEAILVGGGNTFQLIRTLHERGLSLPIAKRARAGTPYIGWSAGANVACPTIRTTNDMPIVEPLSLRALGLVPFQINPHYFDAHPDGHSGETRAQRILEFVEANRGVSVVGLREGSALRVEGTTLRLLGTKTARVFLFGEEPREVKPEESLQDLMV